MLEGKDVCGPCLNVFAWRKDRSFREGWKAERRICVPQQGAEVLPPVTQDTSLFGNEAVTHPVCPREPTLTERALTRHGWRPLRRNGTEKDTGRAPCDDTAEAGGDGHKSPDAWRHQKLEEAGRSLPGSLWRENSPTTDRSVWDF